MIKKGPTIDVVAIPNFSLCYSEKMVTKDKKLSKKIGTYTNILPITNIYKISGNI